MRCISLPSEVRDSLAALAALAVIIGPGLGLKKLLLWPGSPSSPRPISDRSPSPATRDRKKSGMGRV